MSNKGYEISSRSYMVYENFRSKAMTTKIEQLDQKRKRYRKGHLIWSFLFLAAWLVRLTLKIFEIETDIVYTILLIILLLAIALQTFLP